MTVIPFEQPVDAARRLGDELTGIIRGAANDTPRSRQRTIGPSELGEPCLRRLAYRLLDLPRTNTGSDPWKPFVGTAVHAALAPIFEADNTRLGRTRWLVETRVAAQHVPAGSGTADLFDTDTGTVIDWKIIGETSMRNYRKNGAPDRYRTQLHTYGLGFTRAGHDVRHVAMVCLPQSGYLGGHYTWSQPYDETVAVAALRRLNDLTLSAAALDVETHPDRLVHIPALPSHACVFCPWFTPSSADLGLGCPGDTTPNAAPVDVPNTATA
jgi:hypothetical protein